MAKASVGTARLEPTGFRSPRSRRGRHVRKEGQRKRGTTRRSPRRSVHSEGISYKPLSGEIGMCLRVGRMGPQVRIERDRTTRSGAKAPGVERQWAARTEVLQRATFPGTERGSDEGSGEHEGQWQTVRREEASNGKALSDLPAWKPYWGKPTVRNFREGHGNVGIIRSPLRAFALPDQSYRLPTCARDSGRMRKQRGLPVEATFHSATQPSCAAIIDVFLEILDVYSVRSAERINHEDETPNPRALFSSSFPPCCSEERR